MVEWFFPFSLLPYPFPFLPSILFTEHVVYNRHYLQSTVVQRIKSRPSELTISRRRLSWKQTITAKEMGRKRGLRKQRGKMSTVNFRLLFLHVHFRHEPPLTLCVLSLWHGPETTASWNESGLYGNLHSKETLEYQPPKGLALETLLSLLKEGGSPIPARLVTEAGSTWCFSLCKSTSVKRGWRHHSHSIGPQGH